VQFIEKRLEALDSGSHRNVRLARLLELACMRGSGCGA
jgi:hypothetical protein